MGQDVQSAAAASKAQGKGSSLVALTNGGQVSCMLTQGVDNLARWKESEECISIYYLLCLFLMYRMLQ